MKYQIQITDKILKKLEKLSKQNKNKIAEAINCLIEDPRPSGCKKLKGDIDNIKYRIRVGDYRVIYSIKDDILIICIIEVGHRKDVYR